MNQADCEGLFWALRDLGTNAPKRLTAVEWRAASFFFLFGHTEESPFPGSERAKFAEFMDVAPESTYKILRPLISMGLIRRSKVGRETFYALNLEWRPSK